MESADAKTPDRQTTAAVVATGDPVAKPAEPVGIDRKHATPKPDPSVAASIKVLENKQTLLDRLIWWTSIWSLLALPGWVSVYFSIMWFRRSRIDFDPFQIGLLFSFIAVGLIIPAMYLKALKRQAVTEKDKVDLEFELANYGVGASEQRAERLFRGNERELLRYYRLNVGETRTVLYLGVLCIFAGISIVVFTLATLMYFQASANANFDAWSKGLAAGLGAVSTIMIQVVAAIYVQMYGKSADQLSQFHIRLVHTHELFLANMLASRIGDTEKEEALLADLAKALAKPEGSA